MKYTLIYNYQIHYLFYIESFNLTFKVYIDYLDLYALQSKFTISNIIAITCD